MAIKKKQKMTKTTVLLPEELLKEAVAASGENITTTLRMGLEVIAAKRAYQKLLKLKGTYKSKVDPRKLRED